MMYVLPYKNHPKKNHKQYFPESKQTLLKSTQKILHAVGRCAWTEAN